VSKPYENTFFREEHNTHVLRSMLATSLFQYQWQPHATGILRATVRPNCRPGTKLYDTLFFVHIWHPDLVLSPTPAVGEDIHTHEFMVQSTVLHGSLPHVEWEAHDDPNGTHNLWRGPLDKCHSPRPVSLTRRAGRIHNGCTYTFPADFLHSVTPDELAITVVTPLPATLDVEMSSVAPRHLTEARLHNMTVGTPTKPLSYFLNLAHWALNTV
jgi:hypothetical protein